jgi:uncharacterized protein YgiM (DUF1202 family)
MATKIYSVVKNGETLEELKTLTAAKKLADTEGAEVFSDGKCVYKGVTENVTVEPVVAEKPKQPETMEPEVQQYRLKAFMNVRQKPDINSTVLSTKPEGTVVRVLGIENDWLHLTDHTYILYKDGQFAEKV